jgi:hypothetical protein
MKISSSVQYALGICAAIAMLAGCSSAGSQLPLSPSGPMQNAVQSGLNTHSLGHPAGMITALSGVAKKLDHDGSWMAPDAKNNDLLYISDGGVAGDDDFAVYVYSYPDLKLKGKLTGFNDPEGECVDKAGDVWIANVGTSQIIEYAHGGTSPIATLNDPDGYSPLDCAVDNTTGNLAVANPWYAPGGPGNVSIYTKAAGTPKSYIVPCMNNPYFLTYDNKSNLFVDGIVSGSCAFSDFMFVELPHGSSTFRQIKLAGGCCQIAGGVQRDGKYIVVGDPSQSMIYRFAIKGSAGTEVDSAQLETFSNGIMCQFWVEGDTVIAPVEGIYPSNGGDFAGLYHYPAGGRPFNSVGGFVNPYGSAVSKAKT